MKILFIITILLSLCSRTLSQPKLIDIERKTSYRYSLDDAYNTIYGIFDTVSISFLKKHFPLLNDMDFSSHDTLLIGWVKRLWYGIVVARIERRSISGIQDIFVSMDSNYRPYARLLVGRTGKYFRTTDSGRTPMELRPISSISVRSYPLWDKGFLNIEFGTGDVAPLRNWKPLLREDLWSERWKVCPDGSFRKMSDFEIADFYCPPQLYSGMRIGSPPQGNQYYPSRKTFDQWLDIPDSILNMHAPPIRFQWIYRIFDNMRVMLIDNGYTGSSLLVSLDSSYHQLDWHYFPASGLAIAGCFHDSAAKTFFLHDTGFWEAYSTNTDCMVPVARDAGRYHFMMTISSLRPTRGDPSDERERELRYQEEWSIDRKGKFALDSVNTKFIQGRWPILIDGK